MKYIRLASDIHLDFDIAKFNKTRKSNSAFDQLVQQEGDMAFLWFPDQLPEDVYTTLVLAGDLWNDTRILDRKFTDGDSWMARCAKRFKYIVFVLGNHDYWGCNLHLAKEKVNKRLQEQGLTNVFLLERDTVVLDQVKFVGATLWTDLHKNNPFVVLQAPDRMYADYHRIRSGPAYRKLQPQDVMAVHKQSADYIFEHAWRDNDEQKVVVVTHMAPSEQSISELYRQTASQLLDNYFYFSELQERVFVEGNNINLWFHGHTHVPCEYVLENQAEGCRVVCNPRGYAGHEDTSWNPTWRVEV